MFLMKPSSTLRILVELRGVEPLSENPSNRTSSITAALLTFPPRNAGQQAFRFSSFINTYQPAKLKADRFSLFMMPLAQEVSVLRATKLLKQLRQLYRCLRLYLGSVFLRGHGPRMAIRPSKSPSKPVQPRFE